MKPFDYLFITYIVTSKPKRISVAAGVVHMVLILKSFLAYAIKWYYTPVTVNYK
jgi:hypothetical protein